MCYCFCRLIFSIFFFFNDTATTEIYTLSLHDALPIFRRRRVRDPARADHEPVRPAPDRRPGRDRKSTRLNSSHMSISYAVFCLKKKKTSINRTRHPVTPYAGRSEILPVVSLEPMKADD